MKKILFVIWFLVLGSYTAQAASIGYTEDPLKISIGARAMGMGGAFAAVRDGHNNFFNNPAGMAGQELRISSMSTSLLGDVNYFVAGSNWPAFDGAVGVGVAASGVSGFITPTQQGFEYFDYRNNVLAVSYARESGDTALGLRLKLFDEGFSGSQNHSGSGFDLDLGLIVPAPWERTKFGLVVTNFMSSNAGSRILWPGGNYEEIPAALRAGIASKYLTEELLMAADYDICLERMSPPKLRAGIEWRVLRALRLRGGLSQSYDAGSLSSAMTFGVGVSFRSFVFDYAYHPYFGLPDAATHFFSLSYGIESALPAPREEPPAFTVDQPAPGTVVTGESVRIAGQLHAVNIVRVVAAGRNALIAADRRFRIENVPAHLGLTTVEVRALDSDGSVILALPVDVFRGARFPDVPDGYWAKKEIETIATMKAIPGYPDDLFRPEEGITRGELVNAIRRGLGEAEIPAPAGEARLTRAGAALVLAEGLKLPAASGREPPYADMPNSHWAVRQVCSLKEEGYLDYITGTAFSPRREFARAEASYILARAFTGR